MTSVGAEMIISTHPNWLVARGNHYDLPESVRAVRLARSLIHHYGVNSAPVPVFDIAKNQQVRVAVGPIIAAGESRARRTKNLGGDTYEALIQINSNQTSAWKRFALAHELGHVLMHDFKGPDFWYRDRGSFIANNAVEQEANRFAMALLMPESVMRETASYFRYRAALLADHFDVPLYFMRARLKELYV